MMTLVFFLEERSAREMLKAVLPRIIPPTITTKFIVFEGKQDLEKQIERRLKGWQMPDTRFLIICDQDAGDCVELKHKLLTKCRRAGKPDALVRIACRELESFYLGDLCAVEKGLGLSGISRMQNKRQYRDPDKLSNPAGELVRLTQKKYQKIAGSRAIGPHLDLTNNRPRSFAALIAGIKKIINEIEE